MGVLVRILTNGALLGLAAAGSAFAQSSMLLATSLSPAIQNEQADKEGIVRIRTESTLKRLVKTKALVPVPAKTRTYYLKGVPARYSYLRPWSKTFLDRLGKQHYAEFGSPLRVTSLVRTEGFQLRLAGYNGNAAPASGRNQSSHLTGATLDISKALMSPAEKEWMREQLVTLREKGHLYGIEEHQQPTFHIMVYKQYAAQDKTLRVKSKVKLQRVSAPRARKAKARRRRA